jgi:hypothetical protein
MNALLALLMSIVMHGHDVALNDHMILANIDNTPCIVEVNNRDGFVMTICDPEYVHDVLVNLQTEEGV